MVGVPSSLFFFHGLAHALLSRAVPKFTEEQKKAPGFRPGLAPFPPTCYTQNLTGEGFLSSPFTLRSSSFNFSISFVALANSALATLRRNSLSIIKVFAGSKMGTAHRFTNV